LFVFISFLLIRENIRVKGDISKTFHTVVWDDNKRMIVGSTSLEVNEILSQNNILVFPEDIVTTDLIMDPVIDGGAGQKIVIKRAPIFKVSVDGGSVVIHSWGKTVGEVINGKIVLGLRDIVVPDVSSQAIPGEITITRINVVETEETVSVPFQTIKQNDYNMYQGKSAITQNGVNGLKKLNVRIVYENGIEVDRAIISSEIMQPAQSKIIAIGVKPYSHEDLWNIMLQAKTRYGIEPIEMFNVMICESGGNILSGAGSSYQGLFQWDGSFYGWAAKAGVPEDFFNPTSQIMATAVRVSASGGWGAWANCAP
jgi:uncharacterized protein YabE (DUF348 family)